MGSCQHSRSTASRARAATTCATWLARLLAPTTPNPPPYGTTASDRRRNAHIHDARPDGDNPAMRGNSRDHESVQSVHSSVETRSHDTVAAITDLSASMRLSRPTRGDEPAAPSGKTWTSRYLTAGAAPRLARRANARRAGADLQILHRSASPRPQPPSWPSSFAPAPSIWVPVAEVSVLADHRGGLRTGCSPGRRASRIRPGPWPGRRQ